MVGPYRNHRLHGNDDAGLEANALLLSIKLKETLGSSRITRRMPMAYIITKHTVTVRLGEGLNGIPTS